MKSARFLFDKKISEQRVDYGQRLKRTNEPLDTDQETIEICSAREHLYDLLAETKTCQRSEVCKAEWNSSERAVFVTKVTSKLRQHMGYMVPGDSRRGLHPEEAIFLLDTGSLELFADGTSVPLSMEQALCLLGSQINFSQYLVYSHLSRGGHLVVRHIRPSQLRGPCRREQADSCFQSPILNKDGVEGNSICGTEERTEWHQIAQYFCSVEKFMKEGTESVERMDFRGIEEQWSGPFQKKIPKSDQQVAGCSRASRDVLDSFPNNHGDYVTRLIPPPSDCFPVTLDWRGEKFLQRDSRHFTEAPLKEFISHRDKRRKIERRDFGRPHNWLYMPDWILNNSKNWTEYKKNREAWLNSFELDERTDHLWEDSSVLPLVSPTNLKQNVDSVVKDLQVVQSQGASKSEGDQNAVRCFTFDVHLPEKDYSISCPVKPKTRVIVLNQSDPCLSHQDISNLREYCSDHVEICAAVVSGGHIQYFQYQ